MGRELFLPGSAITLMVATSLALPAVPALADQCPGAGCRIVVPGQQEGADHVAQRLEVHIADEKTVLSSISDGATPAACSVALGKAMSMGRVDLVQEINERCNQHVLNHWQNGVKGQ